MCIRYAIARAWKENTALLVRTCRTMPRQMILIRVLPHSDFCRPQGGAVTVEDLRSLADERLGYDLVYSINILSGYFVMSVLREAHLRGSGLAHQHKCLVSSPGTAYPSELSLANIPRAV